MNKALIIGLLLIGITLSCTCDDGLLYERKTNSCIPKIPNCTAMTYTLGVYACEICEEGYLVDKEGNCIVIDAPNCAKASFEKSENKVICQQCKQGFYDKDDQCLEIPAEDLKEGCTNYYLRFGRQLRCNACALGYSYNWRDYRNPCIKNEEPIQCTDQQYFSEKDGECNNYPQDGSLDYIENCILYREVYSRYLICDNCGAGTYHSSDRKSCTNVPQQYQIEGCFNYRNYHPEVFECYLCQDNYTKFSISSDYYINICQKCPNPSGSEISSDSEDSGSQEHYDSEDSSSEKSQQEHSDSDDHSN